jgi:phosphoribosylanthranilate isomerase
MRYRLKVCCIQDAGEAECAIRLGASLLGLVSQMPSGPGPIPEDRIAAIARDVPVGVTTVLLTCATRVGDIVEQHRRCRTGAIQLVDALPEGSHAELRARLPGIGLVQVVHVTGPESVEEALGVAPFVDALLLDSGNPRARVKELGGTGRLHDWGLSRRIVETSGKPVYLAGGLRPDNIAEAAGAVDPFGFDVCTGVRTDGRLDPEKLSALARALPA